MQQAGWLKKAGSGFQITAAGQFQGRKIIRLHHLWELYLVKFCGVKKSRAHPSAEEMEHILTKEIEEELAILLHHPKQLIPSAHESL